MAIEKLGPYRIQSTLGRGGMGAVYAGVHDETGERAAIKVLPETLADDPRFRERFRGEVETLKKLRHDGIVALRGHGEQDGLLFFVMELVEGSSLDVELKAGRKFDWRASIDMAVQICAALKHAHDSGVIHRDLKPANLLLTADGRVKLTDFGIAKLFGSTSLTMAGSMVGTPEYMSPEQAVGEGVTARSDLYSLGCVMYALLCGRPPFAGSTITQLIDRVRNADPPSLRTYAPEVPPEVEQIIMELLRKDPQQRIATAQALARLLKATEHALTTERKPEPPEPTAFEVTDKTQTPLVTRHDGSRPIKTIAGQHGATARLSEENLHETRISDASFEIAEGSRVPTQQGTVASAAGKSAAEPESPPAASRTHFTTVRDEDLGRLGHEPAAEDPHYVRGLTLAGIGLGLLAILAAFIVVLLPKSADRHYQQVAAALVAAPPTIDGELLIEDFLVRFPDDPRAAEVTRQLDDFRTRKLRYDLEQKFRSLTEHEKLFLEGMKLFDKQRTAEAHEAFRRIVEELGGTVVGPPEKKLIERANAMFRRTLPDGAAKAD